MNIEELVILFRPIGAAEYALVLRSGFREFPARLMQEPLVSVVTTEDAALRLAGAWNVRDAASGFVGYVARFAVRGAWLERYPRRALGDDIAEAEYVIPAEHIAELNRQIVGPIQVVAEVRPEVGDDA